MTSKNDDVKLIAFHLPQFHSFKENDEWWGEGFTEWTNTKKAKPQFDGHRQPREPKDDYYYNMLEYETRKWQAELAKKYSIYGFCYYHYWFDGRLLMEKPLELLLEEKEIDLPFCMCWANEPWTRAWDGKVRDVLMPQKYGEEKEWQQHFDYLLPFFKDDRYIKIENKPVFVLYRTQNIEQCDKMIQYWDEACIEQGFSGIYIIEELNSFQDKAYCEHSSALLEFEPMYTLTYKRSFLVKLVDKLRNKVKNRLLHKNIIWYRYDTVWKSIIGKKREDHHKKILPGAFVDWDNTARKQNNALIIEGATPQKFKKYLSMQCDEARKNGMEYVFINAWNEWAEGTYLEPDKEFGYSYLEAIKEVCKNK